MRSRLHWFSMVTIQEFIPLVFAAAVLWFKGNLTYVLHAAHIQRHSPFAPVVEILYKNASGIALTMAGLSLLIFFYSFLTWQIGFYEIDDDSITYKLSLFSSNILNRNAINDIIRSQGLIGSMLGFADLRITTATYKEVLRFVPQDIVHEAINMSTSHDRHNSRSRDDDEEDVDTSNGHGQHNSRSRNDNEEYDD